MLELQNLHCSLGRHKVLQGLSAGPLQAGTVVAVLGRNGVGKSTLLRAIAGMVPCSATRLHLGGRDLQPLRASERATAVRYLPQAAPGMLHLTVQESLAVALNAHHHHPASQARERIAATAAELGLTTLLDRHLDELSGGQKQLVWLAQALVHRPQVLLLDEPLAALDPNYQHHVMQHVRRLAAEQQMLVMVVLHDLNMALRHADHALILQDGVVIGEGAVQATLTTDTLARAFLVEARIEHCPRGTPLVVIDDLLTL